MNYTIEKIKTDTGKDRHEVRVWGIGEKDIKRRFKTSNEALEFLKGLQNQKERQDAGEILFGSLVEHWFGPRADKELSPGWIIEAKKYWEEMRSTFENMNVFNLTLDFMNQVSIALKGRGNSQKTVNNKLGFIVSVLNHAVSTGKLKYNPVAAFRLTKPIKTEIDFWELDQAQSFLSFANEKYNKNSKDRWIYVVYYLAINAAPRAGEIWALKPSCIKKSMQVLRITEQFDIRSKTFRTPKGREPRSVPLNETLLRELELLIGKNNIRENEWIFSRPDGRPINHKKFYERRFMKDVKAWGGKKITFHGLRHTGATLMLNAGLSVKTVMQILGHKEIETTMRYVHLMNDDVKNASKTFSVNPEKPNLGLRIVK